MDMRNGLLIVTFAGALAACTSDRRNRPPDLAVIFSDRQDLSPSGDLVVYRDRDAACGEVIAQEMAVRTPVDIIFIVDNAVVIADPLHAIELTINSHFADLLGNSGVDYRVIVLSRYGNWRQRGFC